MDTRADIREAFRARVCVELLAIVAEVLDHGLSRFPFAATGAVATIALDSCPCPEAPASAVTRS
jgi:hypothetical protein